MHKLRTASMTAPASIFLTTLTSRLALSWRKGSTGKALPPGLRGANHSKDQTERTYLNFIGDEGEERVRTAYYPEKFRRLVALKDKDDPNNLFRLNQNIKPPSRNGAAS